MKLLAILIMLAALYLLYRIAFPKQADTAKGDTVQPEQSKTNSSAVDVMGKSRFVLSDSGKSLQAAATAAKTETTSEKATIFAAETAGQPSKAIPENELDKVFANNLHSEIFSIPLKTETDNESEIDFAEEETEELNSVFGGEAIYADGVDYDKLQTAVKAVTEQADEISAETAQTLLSIKNTDMFEMLVAKDEGKTAWIKSLIERHIHSAMPETDTENETTDYGDFEVADFIS